MFQRHQQRAILLFAAADTALATLAFWAAFWTRAALPMRDLQFGPSARALVFIAAVATVVATGRATGAYARLYSAGTARAFADTLRQALTAALALLAFLYLLNLEVPVSRLLLALFFGYLTALQLAQRALAARFRGRLRHALGTETSVLVVGDGEKARDIARELEASRRHGVRLAGLLSCGEGTGPADGGGGGRSVAELPAMLNEEAIDEVLFAVSSERLRELENVLALCDEHGIKTHVLADFFPRAHSRVDFDRLGERPLLTFSTAPDDDLQLLAKRCLDAAAAAASLVALCVPMALVALLVKTTSRGPVLFRQQRCGLNGRLFTCYKFRSMVLGAEARREELEHLNEKDGPAFKIRDDPRLTPVGGFLRRFSIDEWPQFWNVLRGEMSFVGPRPAVPAEVRRYEIWQRRRLRMRPGLTCLWAVRGRDRLDFDRWMQLDLEYIDNWSLLLDAKILALTVPVVLAGRGAS